MNHEGRKKADGLLYILLILECDNPQSENKGCYRNTKTPDRAGEKPGSLWSPSAGQITFWLLKVPEGATISFPAMITATDEGPDISGPILTGIKY